MPSFIEPLTLVFNRIGKVSYVAGTLRVPSPSGNIRRRRAGNAQILGESESRQTQIAGRKPWHRMQQVTGHGPSEGDRHIFPGTTLDNHPTARDTFLEFAGKISQSPARERLPPSIILAALTSTRRQTTLSFQKVQSCSNIIK